MTSNSKSHFSASKASHLILTVLLMATASLHANGDPVAYKSAMILSMTPVAVHVPEVQIIDEKITFTPTGHYTEVVVRYLLHNHSAKDFVSLPYGFPIDYQGNNNSPDPAVPGWVGEHNFGGSIMEVGWSDRHIREVSFLLDDRQLQWQCSKDTMLIKPTKKIIDEYYFDYEPDSAEVWSKEIDKKILDEYGDEALYLSEPVMRRWYYTYLDIKAGSYAMLEVRYKILNHEEMSLQFCNPPFENYKNDHLWEYAFFYDFTPAAYWGDGHADKFTFTVDASHVKLNYMDDTLLYDDKPLTKNNDLYLFEALHFDLANAKALSVYFLWEEPRRQNVTGILNSSIDKKNYTVKASGHDKRYPLTNISDLDLTTATVLRPDKDNNIFLTITFNKPTKMKGLILYNGYTKSPETWLNNSRIDSLMIRGDFYGVYDYEDGDGIIHQDTERFDNECLYCDIRWNPTPQPSEEIAVKCPVDCPQTFDWQTLTDNAIIVSIGSLDNTLYYKEIRLFIKSTAKGMKYDDLCLSEIILVGE